MKLLSGTRWESFTQVCNSTLYLPSRNLTSGHPQLDQIRYASGSLDLFSPLTTWEKTVSSVLTFILAMVLNPDVQKKAQAELDAVVGRDRLPTFADQPDLPYINAITRETVRWQPVTPLGIAHKSIAEDVYDGYRIPAGTCFAFLSVHLSKNLALPRHYFHL